MIKYIILIVMPLFVSSCSAALDATFYSLHPKELQQALQQCPEKHPAGVSCEQLNNLAMHANILVSELQYDPQRFGKKILTLQEELAQYKAALNGNPEQTGLQASIEKNKVQLGERLAIVKWLESPRG